MASMTRKSKRWKWDGRKSALLMWVINWERKKQKSLNCQSEKSGSTTTSHPYGVILALYNANKHIPIYYRKDQIQK